MLSSNEKRLSPSAKRRRQPHCTLDGLPYRPTSERIGPASMKDTESLHDLETAEGFAAASETCHGPCPEDVAAIRAAIAPILAAKDRSRPTLHMLLDACLDLVPHAGASGGHAERVAREIARALATGSFGWTEPRKPTHAIDWDALATNPPAWRLELYRRLSLTPHVLPWPLVTDLLTSLISLHDGTGQTPPLLRPFSRA
jgi:hypothetical protein